MANTDLLFHLVKVTGVSSEPLSPWTERFIRCMTAYISRDYPSCAAAGRESLSQEVISSVGLVTVLSLRRLGQPEEAEELSRILLQSRFAGGEGFLLFMMLLDGAMNPATFLQEQYFGGYRIDVTPELECRVNFYWGAKLLTEAKFHEALERLSISVNLKCNIVERLLAEADLQTARTQFTANNGK